MRNASLGVGIVILVMTVSIHGYAGEYEKNLARAIAEYLVAARTVIAVNQELINDPARGENRFTSGVYANLVRDEFLKTTGIDISRLEQQGDASGSVIGTLHQSALQVIDTFQARINRPGQGFKGVNPAMFGTWVGQEFNKRTGIGLKQTSTRYRATYNQPDDFETSILKQYEASGKSSPHYEETAERGKTFARYIVPLYITTACLDCHGEPAGELDMTGRAKEGYKEGQLRGGISVVVPVSR